MRASRALFGFRKKLWGLTLENHAQRLRLVEGGRHPVLDVLPTSKGSRLG